MKSLVNNITALNQEIYRSNKRKLEKKPYGRYFKKDMYLFDDVIRYVQSGLIPEDELMLPTADNFNAMLESDLWKSTGYGVLEDNSLYIASLTEFPGTTKDMFEWWFWWHSVESERYALWYPYCHVSIEAKNKAILKEKNASHKEKYMGNTHVITEYLNDTKNDIEITFIEPGELGFRQDVLDKAGIVASACGTVYTQKPRARGCTMIHLFKETAEGGQLISRYFFGDQMALVFGSKEIKFPQSVKGKVLKSDSTGIQTAYEQLMHDQIEFTHLASFLPDLYKEFS